VDQDRIRKAVREILLAVGENPDREGLLETPDRVARMYAEVFGGLHSDPAVHLQKTFTQKTDNMVLVKDIEFASCCEHHLLPFIGKTHIAYLPNGRVVGLSKLARVVDAIAKRPQVQERMTEDYDPPQTARRRRHRRSEPFVYDHSRRQKTGRDDDYIGHARVVAEYAGDPTRVNVVGLWASVALKNGGTSSRSIRRIDTLSPIAC
jgi:GTP cyclohydrolase I